MPLFNCTPSFKIIFQLALCAAIFISLMINANAQQSITTSPLDARTPSGLQAGSETINPYNGNLTYVLPLLKVGGRGEAGYTIVHRIDQRWIVRHKMSNYNCMNNPYCSGPMHSYTSLLNWRDFGGGPTFLPGGMKGRKGGGFEYSQALATGVMSLGVGRLFLPLINGYNDPYVTNTQNTLTRLTFTANDGSEYEFVDQATGGRPNTMPCTTTTPGFNRGKVFITRDGSAMTFVSDSDIRDLDCSKTDLHTSDSLDTHSFGVSGYLYLRDGTVYRIDGAISWMRDRNGNYVRFIYGTNGLAAVADSLGRQVTFTYGANYTQLDYKGFNAQPRTIRVYQDNLANLLRPDQTLKTKDQLFGIPFESNPSEIFNPLLTSAVELPDGRRYRFYYNSYGELARIEMPTGGAVEYDFAAGVELVGMDPQSSAAKGVIGSDGGYNIYRRVTEQRVYPNGGTGDDYERRTTYSRIRYTYTTNSNGGLVLSSTENEDSVAVDQYAPTGALLARTKHYFHGDPYESLTQVQINPSGYSRWNEGKEFKTEVLDDDGVTLLRRIENEWRQREPLDWWPSFCANTYSMGYCYPNASIVEPPNDVRLASVMTTLADSNQVTKKEFAYDDFNNPTDTYDYDYGNGAPGALLRHSHTDYVTGTNYTSETGAHLRSLPSQSWVSADAAGVNKKSLTVYEYDRYVTDSRHAPLRSYANIRGLCLMLDTSGNCVENSTPTYLTRGNATGATSYILTNGAVTKAIPENQEYDVAGNIVEKIDPRGKHTSLDFTDRFGLPNGEARANTAPAALNGQGSYAFPTKITNALGHVSYNQYDFYHGGVVDSEDANGAVYSASYNDPFGRQTQVKIVVDAVAVSQTSFSYDDLNRKNTTTSDLKLYDDNLLKSEVLYDGLGRATASRQYEPDGSFITSAQEYDALGRVGGVSNPYRAGEIIKWTRTEYDALGRVIKVTSPGETAITNSGKVTSSYYGADSLVEDQANKRRMSRANALGQLTDVWEIKPADPSDSATEAITFPNKPEVAVGYHTKYAYDTLGNLTNVTQRVGSATSNPTQTRTFIYDSLSRLTSAANPESGTVIYEYDDGGNLAKLTDARSIITVYTYDNLNRVTSKTYQNDGGVTPPVYYKYDSQSLPSGAPTFDRGASTGRLVAVLYGGPASTAGSYAGYDALGRVKRSLQRTFDGGTNQTYIFPNYEYDLAGNLTSQTYPSGRTVINTYDDSARLSQVSGQQIGEADKAYASTFSYSPHGAVTGLKLGNNLWEHTKFNARLQPTEIWLGTTQNGSNKLKLNYSYGTTDNNGSVKSQTIVVPGGPTLVQTYTYDALNRLDAALETKSGVQTWKQKFTYDRFGNRRFNQGETTANVLVENPSISPNNNRIDATGYDYDDAGNLKCDPSHPCVTITEPYPVANQPYYKYDAENRLYSSGAYAYSYSSAAGYCYDGEGRRVRKSSGGTATIFVYNAMGQLVAEYGSQPGGSDVSYITQDQLGSTRLATDSSGLPKSRHDYLPFGEEIRLTDVTNSGRMDAQGYKVGDIRQKFTGYERDDESGLDFAQARYYSSQQGRFTSTDPLLATGRSAMPQSWNRYAYVLNNPLSFTDPTGLGEQGASTIKHEDRFLVEETETGSIKIDVMQIAEEDLPDDPPDETGYVENRVKSIYALTYTPRDENGVIIPESSERTFFWGDSDAPYRNPIEDYRNPSTVSVESDNEVDENWKFTVATTVGDVETKTDFKVTIRGNTIEVPQDYNVRLNLPQRSNNGLGLAPSRGDIINPPLRRHSIRPDRL